MPRGSPVEAGENTGSCPLNLSLFIGSTKPEMAELLFALLEARCHYSW